MNAGRPPGERALRAELALRGERLAAERVPFVRATVVRAQRPSSVRPGDAALVLGDGTIEGFVGGACAEQSVRMHALRALETEEPILLRILPGNGGEAASEGAVTVENPCLSGGGMEVFLEPQVPAPRLVVAGDTPVAAALRDLAARLGFETAESVPEGGEAAVVVASHGRDEVPVLEAALRAGVPYVGLVASEPRGASVRAALDVTPEQAARLRTPAGLPIGARTAEEIALSILAQVVADRRAGHAHPAPAPAAAPAPRKAGARDPVCGMAVTPGPDTPYLDVDGGRVWFCGEHCRRAFADDPARHATAG
jgi:xanthine dehydrogenase accessory factor